MIKWRLKAFKLLWFRRLFQAHESEIILSVMQMAVGFQTRGSSPPPALLFALFIPPFSFQTFLAVSSDIPAVP